MHCLRYSFALADGVRSSSLDCKSSTFSIEDYEGESDKPLFKFILIYMF